MAKRTNEKILLNFREHFGKLVNNSKSFNDMIVMLSELEDKRILFYIIEKFWFIEQQRCHYWKPLPKKLKSYYRPYFRSNMVAIMTNAISYCRHMDCTTRLKDENGNWLFANDCEIACQFNKSNCDDFIRCVLSTYFKINCKV